MNRSAVPHSIFIPYALDINIGLGVLYKVQPQCLA
jgi:hypothetical protein